MTKNSILSDLYARYNFCGDNNPYYIAGAKSYVPGFGNENSVVMVIGEAPGEEEENTQKPFQGRSGKLLRTILAKYGFDDTTMFVTNVVKFRPPKNRKPTEEEIAIHMTVLLEEIAVIQPKYVVLVGATALVLYTNDSKLTISKLRGKVFFNEGMGCFFFPIYHPAYILRNLSLLSIFENDIAHIASYVKNNA